MPSSKLEREFHDKTKARCFNEAWEFLEKKHRTVPDAERMLNLAHAARFHAGVGGDPRSQGIGDWQISRVYAALHEPRLAMMFAQSALEIFETHLLSDLTCTGHEAVARAYAVADDPKSAKDHIAKARELLDASSVDAEGREIFLGQIRQTERLIGRPSVGRV